MLIVDCAGDTFIVMTDEEEDENDSRVDCQYGECTGDNRAALNNDGVGGGRLSHRQDGFGISLHLHADCVGGGDVKFSPGLRSSNHQADVQWPSVVPHFQ